MELLRKEGRRKERRKMGFSTSNPKTPPTPPPSYTSESESQTSKAQPPRIRLLTPGIKPRKVKESKANPLSSRTQVSTTKSEGWEMKLERERRSGRGISMGG